MTITQTLVFQFDDQEQRKATLEPLMPLAFADSRPCITGLSSGDELTRSQLMEEALEQCQDENDLRLAIEQLAAFEDPRDWSWDDFHAQP